MIFRVDGPDRIASDVTWTRRGAVSNLWPPAGAETTAGGARIESELHEQMIG